MAINITLDDLNFKAKEAIKTLRTNIEFSGDDKKVIVLTSCVPDEGKSTIAMNLVNGLADAGKKVLLIDADMRKSVLVGRLKVNEEVRGLSHFLTGHNTITEVISRTKKDNLSIIFAGVVPPNPAELLSSPRFASLIDAARNAYDYVIIDAPPIGAVVDAAVIAKYCDGVIMVVGYASVSYRLAQDVKKQIEVTGCPILGVVLNKVPSGGEHGYGYYGSYYGKYYGGYYGGYYGKKEGE